MITPSNKKQHEAVPPKTPAEVQRAAAIAVQHERKHYKPFMLDGKLMPARVYDGMLLRLKKMQDSEIKRNGYPISMADIMRKCLAVGLQQWEEAQR
jgi:hypothetical protein